MVLPAAIPRQTGQTPEATPAATPRPPFAETARLGATPHPGVRVRAGARPLRAGHAEAGGQPTDAPPRPERLPVTRVSVTAAALLRAISPLLAAVVELPPGRAQVRTAERHPLTVVAPSVAA